MPINQYKHNFNTPLEIKDLNVVGDVRVIPEVLSGLGGNFTATGTIQGTQIISTIATGTAPLTVSSTTLVNNLNADLLDGQHGSYYLNTSTTFGGDVTGTYNNLQVTNDSHTHAFNNLTDKTSGTGNYTTTGTFTGNTLASTVATGTAPLTVSSTTLVNNLNADLLDGLEASQFLREEEAIAFSVVFW